MQTTSATVLDLAHETMRGECVSQMVSGVEEYHNVTVSFVQFNSSTAVLVLQMQKLERPKWQIISDTNCFMLQWRPFSYTAVLWQLLTSRLHMSIIIPIIWIRQ